MSIKNLDFTNVPDVGSGASYLLPAGVYELKIVRLEDNERRSLIKIFYDIDAGVYTGHYKKRRDAYNYDYPVGNISYQEKVLSYAKRFFTALEHSGNMINGVPFSTQKLREYEEYQYAGFRVGAVIGQEEYTKTAGANAGSIGVRNYIAEFVSIPDVRSGAKEIPGFKHLDGTIDPTPNKPKQTATERTEEVEQTAFNGFSEMGKVMPF